MMVMIFYDSPSILKNDHHHEYGKAIRGPLAYKYLSLHPSKINNGKEKKYHQTHLQKTNHTRYQRRWHNGTGHTHAG